MRHGGAGFSARAKDLFAKLLNPVRDLLDCKVDGCVKGCSACVLTPDLHDQQRIIDRQAALSFVDGHLHLLAAPDSADLFVPGASFSDDLADELAAGSGAVIVWSEFFDLAELRDGNFLRLAAFLQRAGRPLTLVLTQAALSAMDDATRLGLRDLAIRYDIALRQGAAPRFQNGAVAVAAVANGRAGEIWATRDSKAGILGSGWGVAAELPILRARWDAEVDSDGLPADILEPRADAAFVSFTKACDGSLSSFGTHLLEMMKPLLQRVGGWRPGHLVKVEYFDRYLKCPLSVRLACECVAALAKAIGSAEQTQMFLVSEPWRSDPRYDDKRPWQVSHDWRSDDDRAEVTEAVAAGLGLRGSLTLKRDRHAREMVLTFDNSRSVTLVFDQGFGCWSGPKGIPLRFDFDADPKNQAAKLIALNAVVQGPGDPSYIVAHR